jgi:hypothetical protein
MTSSRTKIINDNVIAEEEIVILGGEFIAGVAMRWTKLP